MTMLEHAGAIAALAVVAGLIAAAVWGVLAGSLRGGYLAPTVGTALIVAAVVFALFALGARSDRWLENPYW